MWVLYIEIQDQVKKWRPNLWNVTLSYRWLFSNKFFIFAFFVKISTATPHLENEHHHAVHAFISCSWIHNMLIPESITGISCFMFRPKPSQRLPTLHGCALHGFHFHHHVSPGLISCNYGKNHAVHGTCHGSAWFLCQTQKKVKSWRIIKSFSL